MRISRRRLLNVVGATVPIAATAQEASSKRSQSARLLVRSRDQPRAAMFFRLPLSWHKETVARLKTRLTDEKIDVIVLTTQVNITYFTGCWYQHQERHFAAILPMDADAVYWHAPAMDRELVGSWWCTDLVCYFDYPYAEDGLPHEGKIATGPPVDLLRWTMRDLKRRGFAGKRIAVDFPLTPDGLKMLSEVLPGSVFRDIRPTCLRMRMVKTPMEIALAQRAMDYFSQVHVFARDYLLDHGTDLTTRSLNQVLRGYAYDLVMRDLKPTGEAHTAVGVALEVGCKFGRATAHAHSAHTFPDARLKRGDALQISGYFTLGGYGGELYRYFQTAPWRPRRVQGWEVVTESVHIQIRESRPGVRCQDVARKIHELQVKNGVQRLIYHRPGHGSGLLERHQAPYLSLGDPTPMEEGMMFSIEPGLYDLNGGFGFNPSDNLLITKNAAVVQGSIPFTKEWMFLKL